MSLRAVLGLSRICFTMSPVSEWRLRTQEDMEWLRDEGRYLVRVL